MPVVLFNQTSLELGQGSTTVSIVGTQEAVPRGIESLWQYNNLILNDLSTIDKYRIMSLDGLDDADVRDSREDNPSSTGEEAYDSQYGGRTIALKVRVEAYNLFKLRDMNEALRTAFLTLEEKPLYALTGHPEYDHHIYVKKFSKLQSTDEQTRDNAFFRDWMITLRASDPRWMRNKAKVYTIPLTTTTNAEGYQLNVTNSGNYYAYPEIKIYGNTSNIKLTNQTILDSQGNETSFELKSSVIIANNDFRKITTKGRKIMDGSGVNKYSDVKPGSTFLKIAPGSNTIAFEAGKNTRLNSSSLIEIRFKEAWL